MDYIGTGTYSPEDNKLRLYPNSRLEADLYARVKGAGFIWAPKQELFVAPMWTPGREDLLIELCGEIDDEDKSLIDRAEDRAERFELYSEARAKDASQAQKAVSAIADNIPLGQPILVGHHSEKHARKDAERITNGMRKSIKMWEQSSYWKSRAHGAIRAAKYKERPDVRARRIKGLEADKRKQERCMDHASKFIAAWQDPRAQNLVTAKSIANYDHISMKFTLDKYPRQPPISQYEGDMGLWGALDHGIITAEQARDLAIPAHHKTIENVTRWTDHIENRLTYERTMMEADGGTVADKSKPEKGGACKCWASPRDGWSYVQKVNKVSVSVADNWGNGGKDFFRTIPFDKLKKVMSVAEVLDAKKEGRLVDIGDGINPARGFLLKDDILPVKPKYEEKPTDIDRMKDALKAGVQVVVAPQLFPTPLDLAKRMVEEAEIEPGHRVLEPSAGTGSILDAIGSNHHSKSITVIEINEALAKRLHERFGMDDVRCCDFLACNGDLGAFDRILMNPPFEHGSDIKHIQHAISFLNPGGRLVAICANGPRQNEILKPLASTWEELPEDTFKDQGTRVNVALMVYDSVPCGYETTPGTCSKPNEERHQVIDCENCETGTQQAKRNQMGLWR